MKDCRLAAVDSAIQLFNCKLLTLSKLHHQHCCCWFSLLVDIGFKTFFPNRNVFPNKFAILNFFSRSVPAQIRTRRWRFPPSFLCYESTKRWIEKEKNWRENNFPSNSVSGVNSTQKSFTLPLNLLTMIHWCRIRNGDENLKFSLPRNSIANSFSDKTNSLKLSVDERKIENVFFRFEILPSFKFSLVYMRCDANLFDEDEEDEERANFANFVFCRRTSKHLRARVS